MSFPSGILATEVFRSVGLLVRIRGSHLGGFLLGQLPWLGPAPSPRLVCGWQCPVSVCSLHSLCIVQWLSSGVSLTLLALFRVCLLPMGWVFTLSFFLRPLLFRFFLVQSPWLCCAFVEVPAGVFFAPVAFLPWPVLLSLGPRRS